jgi:hypothetical protein
MPYAPIICEFPPHEHPNHFLEITELTSYRAQEILTAISQFCGNQTEAFAYCQSLPDVSILDCQGFDPSGGGVAPNCTQAALDVYNICGNSTGGDYFADGDPESLAQCLYFNLSLCTPEDGEGHFNTIFTGMQTDCPFPSYTPACGVYSTSGAAATTTAFPAFPSSSSAAPSFQSTEPGPPLSPASPYSSSTSAAPSFQTTEPGPPLSTTVGAPSFSTITTSTPVTGSFARSHQTIPTAPKDIPLLTPFIAPTAPPSHPPPGASPYFYLTINGTFTLFVGGDGGVIRLADSVLAQIFYIANGQLFTIDGLLVQADQGANPAEPVPHVLFAGSEGTLPFSTTFSLATAGIEPSTEKRQAVGETTLYWINAAFTAPGTMADFCIFEGQVYAVLQSGGVGADFYAGCVSVTLDAIYSKLLPRCVDVEGRVG